MTRGAFETLVVGNETARLYVSGAGDARPRVIVFHPWWGLNDDVLAYADRLAVAGFTVVAPDLVRGQIASTIDGAEHLVQNKDDAHADAVALGAIDRLTASDAGAPIGALGFSMGAQWAMWCAAQRPAIAAAVIYYGTIFGPSLAQSKGPVLGHFAETDPFESDESVQDFDQALREVGRSATIHRYAGTGHWFAEPSRDAWRAAAADLAFERTVSFLREQLAARPVGA